jgi:CxxC motif-containing protein (DUF1111 family)
MTAKNSLRLLIGLSGTVAVAVATAAAPERLDQAGGSTTVFDATAKAYSLPAANLRDEHQSAFFVGNSFFNKNWITAPASVTDRDGLGPLFNARSCSGCHLHDGRGRPPEAGAPMVSMLLRISVPGGGAPHPDAIYGDQIQNQAVSGIVPEAPVLVDYELDSGHYADGEPYTLRRPRVRIANPHYGAASPRLLTSARVSPAVFGLGLLEAVPATTLLALADPDDNDGDGISGRANRVLDLRTGADAIGRFGWKAEQPSLRQQAAAAFRGDMGITSSLFPEENHTARERACAQQPHGGSPEIGDQRLDDVVLYLRTLAVPAQRKDRQPATERGNQLFESSHCARCHRPVMMTSETAALAELANQVIRPYTDLLLHDMGEGLADERPAFEANGREWRTPPLWGLGLLEVVSGHSFLLHDGRARNPAEAILWHGGEATAAREAFRQMPRADREALLRFLGTL